jgi:aspartyl-tRNA(Asn)/glutamyl-tRNA(Gln) amidotransferase subunit A
VSTIFKSTQEYNTSELSDEIRRLWIEAAECLSARGATVKTVSLPHTPYALATYYVLAPAEASSNLARYDGLRFGYRDPNSAAKSVRELYTESRTAGFGNEVIRRIV